jgi:hydrogenase-4 component F
MLIFIILGMPLLLAAAGVCIKSQKARGIVTAVGYGAVLCAAAFLARAVIAPEGGCAYPGFLYLDALGVFFIVVISVIAFAAALYSAGYIRRDMERGRMAEKNAGIYYALFNLFCFSMFLVPAVNNAGVMWVAVEMTTLISAFLVGFYNTKESVEAAWKYIIICSVGIIFALLGTILFVYAFSQAGGIKSLNWSDWSSASCMPDSNLLKIAFIFILVGYGTKAGLAPMHTWLPDAHSQAIAPISALLSGGLLKIALYAIMRFGLIVIKGAGFQYFGNLMLLLGVISLVISCGFILVQKDLKRLLAYSSIEHVGIISIGLGLGTPLALAGAFLHIFNHAAAKSLLFFGAGNIVGVYQKHAMNTIRGVLKVLPFTGIMVLLGVFALTGFPPFSIFISEFLIIAAAFTNGAYAIGVVLLLFLSVIFGAFIFHFGKMLFGNLPKGMAPTGEPLSGKLAFLFLFLQMCAFGIVPLFIKKDIVWITQMLFPR